jgi:acetyl esterase
VSLNQKEIDLFKLLAEENAQLQLLQPEQAPQDITLEAIRGWSKSLLRFAGDCFDILYEDTYIPVRDGSSILARIYNPQLDSDRPCLLFFPGCGYIADNFEINAMAVSRIAAYANAKVFMVDLRLCPEFPMPTPLHDAFDAAKYVITHPHRFNLNPNNVSVGGFSSGAHAAAYVANASRLDHEMIIKQQILLNGCFDLTNSHRDYDAFEACDGLFKRGPVVDYIFEQWGVSFDDPMISPVFHYALTNLPKATILIGEYDGLRNDSEAYYKHLKSLKNNVDRIVLPGQTHNTILLRGFITDGVDPAKVIADLLR